jgi:hypothetical protein
MTGLADKGSGGSCGLSESFRTTNTVPIELIPMLDNTKTNNGNVRPELVHLWLPPLANRYRMALFDEEGMADTNQS